MKNAAVKTFKKMSVLFSCRSARGFAGSLLGKSVLNISTFIGLTAYNLSAILAPSRIEPGTVAGRLIRPWVHVGCGLLSMTWAYAISTTLGFVVENKGPHFSCSVGSLKFKFVKQLRLLKNYMLLSFSN